MDTVSTFASAGVEPLNELSGTATGVDRTVTVIATYQLSENGRKALLLAGG